MKIFTLVKDIQDRLTSGKPFDAETVEIFAKNLAKKLANRLSAEQSKPTLRLSNLGSKCDRKLWYSINTPELSEPLSPSARLKFLFGDILEEVLLFLARASGHTVEDEQAEIDLHGVKGHIDGIIDGELVDCKSASTYGFKKFASHGLVKEDDFGYLTQLDGYLNGLSGRSDVHQERAHFLAVDKTLGHIVLDTHDKLYVDYEKLIKAKRELLSKNRPPERAYKDEPEGKSGNRKLGLACSYCSFKSSCWPNLRAFAYSRGPVFLTHVERRPSPDIEELKI